MTTKLILEMRIQKTMTTKLILKMRIQKTMTIKLILEDKSTDDNDY